jgi:hypothetical protein
MKKFLLTLAIVLFATTSFAAASWQKWNTFGAIIWYPNNGFAMVYVPALQIDENPVEIEVPGLGKMVGRWSKYGYYFSWLDYDKYHKFLKKVKKKHWNIRVWSYTTGLRYKGKLLRWVRY